MIKCSRVVALDTETHLIAPGNLTPKLVCMSTAELPSASTAPTVSLLIAADAVPVFKALITDPTVIIVGQNTAYDLAVLAVNHGLMDEVLAAYSAGRIRDTKIRQELLDIAAGRLNAGGHSMYWDGHKYKPTAYSLAALEQRYKIGPDRVAQKKDANAWRLRYAELDDVPVDLWPPEASEYARADALNTLLVYNAQGGAVPDEVEQCQAAFALHMTSARGICVDPTAIAELERRMLMQQNKNRRRLVAARFLVPRRLLPSELKERVSKDGKVTKAKRPEFWLENKPHVYSKDMTAIRKYVHRIYGRRGDSVPATEKGEIATHKDCLVQSGSHLLSLLSEEGGVEKILNTYVPVLQGGLKAPINAAYNILVNSGRCSSSRPNLQNIPTGRRVAGVRECFVPRPGHVMVSVDYETLELRTLAQCCLWLFGESKLANALNADVDVHCLVAAQLLGIPYEDALARHTAKEPDFKRIRDIAKIANFGYPGGMGPEAFVVNARKQGSRITLQQAKDVKRSWQQAWPEMKQYFEYVSRLTENEDNVIHQLGTKRVRGRCRFTEAANTLFQGLAGSGAKNAMFEVVKECYTSNGILRGCYPLAFIHDECLAEVEESRAQELANRLAEVMISGMQQLVPDVKIKAAPDLMKRWTKDAKGFLHADED